MSYYKVVAVDKEGNFTSYANLPKDFVLKYKLGETTRMPDTNSIGIFVYTSLKLARECKKDSLTYGGRYCTILKGDGILVEKPCEFIGTIARNLLDFYEDIYHINIPSSWYAEFRPFNFILLSSFTPEREIK
jgi:hypothetical protein